MSKIEPGKTLIFYYPSRQVGGAEFLFARLGMFFKDKLNYSVYYVDYRDGFIRKNKLFSSLKFIDYVDGEKLSLEEGGTCITPISNILRLNKKIDFLVPQTKLLFWCLHPYNIVDIMPQARCLRLYRPSQIRFLLQHFFGRTYQRYNSLLRELDKLKSIVFMDIDNYCFNQTLFEGAVSARYLPIVCDRKVTVSDGTLVDSSSINVAVLGRLSMDKIPSLCNVLYQLNNYSSSLVKTVYIIGDGAREKIHPEEFQSIKVVFAGTITGKQLDEYLLKHADIVFAMGTSLLEAGSLGLPAVALPVSFQEFKFHKAHFLYQCKGYSVGAVLSDYKKQADISYDQIFDGVYKGNKKGEWGKSCLDFVLEKHDITNVTNALIKYLSSNECSAKKYGKIVAGLQVEKKTPKMLVSFFKHFAKYVQKW